MSDYLPEEVVLEILHRLPVKSLIQFRCVSKSWNSLITSSAFINSHLTRSLSLPSNSNKLIVRHCVDSPYVDHYKLIDDNGDSFDQIQNIEFPLTSRRIKHFMLIGSANGLFSLYEQERFILWNPSIRKFITLPKPSSYFGSCRQAFGFDPRTNDYKVVRIAFPNSTDMSEEAKPHLIEIYSLNEGSWRITSAPFPPGIWFSDWRLPAASLNGAVHFAVYDENIPSCQLVLSFDLGDEVFRLIPLPNGAFGWSVHTLVIGGSLSLLCYDICKNKCCSIWVMKEYGVVDSWTKQFTINLNGGEMFRVFGLQGNGNILFEAKVPIGWELSSYDPKSEQGKNLGICGRPFHFCVDNYMENLVLLNRPNDTVFERRVSRKRKCRSTSDKERVRRLEERVCQQKTLMPLLETILKQLTGNGKTDRENDHLKSQLIILIQQLRGQSGDMFSGAGDQSATQVQLGSPSANQEM
ncbi:F-box/kelch-repeat protein At3g23880 isoform X2 [Quercus suber]|uniref:F-box/kelch-repeat protein At3g23880 isoform X2 n=1 Tax=Quercus suber TaxID=58331 RepID=UPI000CE2851D|nr:F-box/kelch-repeat protein At3g23880-like [Quercus suber]